LIPNRSYAKVKRISFGKDMVVSHHYGDGRGKPRKDTDKETMPHEDG